MTDFERKISKKLYENKEFLRKIYKDIDLPEVQDDYTTVKEVVSNFVYDNVDSRVIERCYIDGNALLSGEGFNMHSETVFELTYNSDTIEITMDTDETDAFSAENPDVDNDIINTLLIHALICYHSEQRIKLSNTVAKASKSKSLKDYLVDKKDTTDYLSNIKNINIENIFNKMANTAISKSVCDKQSNRYTSTEDAIKNNHKVDDFNKRLRSFHSKNIKDNTVEKNTTQLIPPITNKDLMYKALLGTMFDNPKFTAEFMLDTDGNLMIKFWPQVK